MIIVEKANENPVDVCSYQYLVNGSQIPEKVLHSNTGRSLYVKLNTMCKQSLLPLYYMP